MPKAIIIHGSFGGPEENWFPWLKSELEKLDLEVIVPKFPTPEGQSLEAWLEVFKEYERHLDENTIVIGHSLGPAFLLSVLEKLNKPIKAAFFVASFLALLGDPQFDNINKTFVKKNFNWEKIKKNCGKFYIFHSDNDPYVPLSEGEKIPQKLGIELIVVKGAGHFNKAAGYTEFPLLLEKIKQEL